MSTTISKLEELCGKIAKQREDADQAAFVKKEADKQVELLEAELIELLNGEDKTNYQSKVGTFSIVHRTSVRNPSTPEDKKQFIAYLKEKGLDEQMLSVNSQTLNSYYKAEFAAAQERGDMDFKLPGIGEPTISEIVQFRRAK